MSATKTPCVRCGVPTAAEFCLDCRMVDPDFCAGGRPARVQQKWLAARRRKLDGYEFASWLLHFAAPSSDPANKKRTRASNT